MPSSQEQASRLLDLPPAHYDDLSEDRLLDLQSELARLTDSRPLLVIGAPREVDPSRQATLPVLVGSVQSGLRAWQVNIRTNLWLLLRDLTTGELVVVTPFNDMRRGDAPLLSGVGTPPDPIVARSKTSAVEVIDLRARLGRWLTHGRYVVTAIAHDLRSNSAGLRILDSAAKGEADLAAPRFAQKFEKPSRSLVDLPARAAAQGPVMLRASLQIAAEAGARVDAAALAAWPCHVVMVQLDQPTRVVKLPLTLERAQIAGDTPRFNATFSIDLRTTGVEPLTGSYQVYVDAGSEVLGPYPLVIDK